MPMLQHKVRMLQNACGSQEKEIEALLSEIKSLKKLLDDAKSRRESASSSVEAVGILQQGRWSWPEPFEVENEKSIGEMECG